VLAERSLGPEPARSAALHARAVEAAEAAGDPALLAEVRTYIALSLIFQGRLRHGIAAVEEMLGDVPGELLQVRPGGPVELEGTLPAAVLAVLAWGYVSAGEAPRALDLLHRMVARGAELGSAALEAQGRLFLGLTHVMIRCARRRRAPRGGGPCVLVSITGVTGGAELPEELPAMLARARQVSRVPVAVGFGVSRPEQARLLALMPMAWSSAPRSYGRSSGQPGRRRRWRRWCDRSGRRSDLSPQDARAAGRCTRSG
jgi:hypothetical protein